MRREQKFECGQQDAVELRAIGGSTNLVGQNRATRGPRPTTPVGQNRAACRPGPTVAVSTELLLLLATVLISPCLAQESANRVESVPAGSLSEEVRDLREEVKELRASVAEMRADSERARAENSELRRQLNELQCKDGACPGSTGTGEKAVVTGAVAQTRDNGPSDPPGNSQDAQGSQNQVQEEKKKSARTATLDEEYELLSGKVDDQYQTKVESTSKYRMRISGIVLMNMFSNQGTVDTIDLPTLAFPRPAGDSGGSFGATLRQSELGFEVFGPRVAGARTRADLQVDLAGGFPYIPNGINSGLVRLRTATMRMDWENTSVVAGQDGLFFSPNSPTSFASLAEPALSYAGNLWSWAPQIRVEHKVTLGEQSSLLFQAGILDPVSGQFPDSGYYRQAGAGESSRQPAYGTHAAWTRNVSGQPLRLGMGGFYSRQDYGYGRKVDAWAAMSDVELPLGNQFSISGKFYRGKGLGGLYGGTGRSVLFSGDPTNPYSEVIGLNTVGGWAQLKYRPAPKVEFNAAFGMDNPYAKDVEYFLYAQSYGDPRVAALSKNRAGFLNVIYRPRSDLLFSAEYRRIGTDSIATGGNGAGQLNLTMGVLF